MIFSSMQEIQEQVRREQMRQEEARRVQQSQPSHNSYRPAGGASAMSQQVEYDSFKPSAASHYNYEPPAPTAIRHNGESQRAQDRGGSSTVSPNKHAFQRNYDVEPSHRSQASYDSSKNYHFPSGSQPTSQNVRLPNHS